MGGENPEYGADEIQILEGLKPSESVPVCISEVHHREVFIISYMRL